MSKKTKYIVTAVTEGRTLARPETEHKYACTGEEEVETLIADMLRNGLRFSNQYMTQVVPPSQFIRIEVAPPLPQAE